MIIISDIHLKEKEPFFEHQKKFLDWVIDSYKEETIIFLGDVFDSHAPHWKVYSIFKSFLTQRSQCQGNTFILKGNHDTGYNRGNSLLGINYGFESKIVVIDTDPTEYTIEGKKCLFLPHKHNVEEYENYEWDGDYCFSHLTPREEAFGGKDGVTLSKINAYKIYGHIHLNSKGKGYDFLIPGVPLPTRNGEINNHLYEINETGVTEVEHPIWFEFEDILYPNMPSKIENILNVKGAPSITHVLSMYKGYNVRVEGIELSIDVDEQNQTLDFETNTIKRKFISFADTNEIEEGLKNTCLSYL